jgi:peptidoglycan/LPS O-acetylase OafA/YrhL
MHLSSFLLGMLCGIYLKHTKDKQTSNNGLLLFASFTLIFILIWARPHLENLFGLKLAFTNGLLAPVFLLFIITLARHKGGISKVFSNPKLVLLGEASYSLYILQKPAHGIYDKVIVPRVPLNETIHFYIFLVLLIILSILSYKYFETPMRQLIRRKLQ